MPQIFDGFWLPQELRKELITEETRWIVQYRANGKPAATENPEAIGARWPILSAQQYNFLLEFLDHQRKPAPQDFISRLQTALAAILQQFQQTGHPMPQEAVEIFSYYTGYSNEMINFSMSLFDQTPFEAVRKIIPVRFPKSVIKEYIPLQRMGGPEGQVKFYPAKKHQNLFPLNKSSQLPYQEDCPKMVLGYASGNVLGTAFIITLLGQVSALVAKQNTQQSQNPFPVILIKNSRQEPLFAPFLFSAIENIDPSLLSTVAIMIWDYEDTALQESIVSQADLVLAAAGDQTIEKIEKVIQQIKPSIRFHQHGHKISFTTIGKTYLVKPNQPADPFAIDLIDQIALLAALDSIVWDQNGCLSSRVHFIERGTDSHYTPREYGRKLAAKLRILSQKLPRGTIPLTRIHDRFDHFNAQTISPEVEVCSNYEDDFIVVVDERRWNQQIFRSIVNTCLERTIVVRPIKSIREVPDNYLAHLPLKNLQTMYVAIDGKEHNNWSPEFSQFVENIGKRGVTSIRTVGQSPFPQLAYSWDGYMPQSLTLRYPLGYFTTVEFDQTFSKIMQVWQWLEQQLE